MHFNYVYLVQGNNYHHCQHSNWVITIITTIIITVIVVIITGYKLRPFRLENVKLVPVFPLHEIQDPHVNTHTSIRILQYVYCNTNSYLIHMHISTQMLQYMRFSKHTR
jgi:hypothetical protein